MNSEPNRRYARRSHWPFVLSAVGALVATLLLAMTVPAPAQEPPGLDRCGFEPVSPDWCGTGTGGLHLVVDGHTVDAEFPLKHTDVQVDISGAVASVRVTQTFQNPYDETIEAVYVFPLPHEAAVNDLEMRLGERVIRGIIERRDEARRIYENARNAGQVAALLEQERPNIFTQSVANILPGNEIEISITYVETLDYEKGVYEFAFPMVVGPRFIPPGPSADLLPAGGFVPVPTPGVSDADRITPPYLRPEVRSGHDIDVTVNWDAGIPIEQLTCATHRVDTRRDGRQRASITLHPNDTIPNKDFVLRCTVEGDGPEAGVLAYHDGDSGYLTFLLHPKLNLKPSDVTPKEMIFVLDCSGSMSGEPIEAAKGLVRHALRNVNERDTFQIIRFSTNASGLAARPLPATPANVKRGIDYIDQLSGTGGTMMIEGIKAALDFPDDPDRLRIVMFLTDGYIGNDDQILSAVRARIGGARLFSFGVGSSVNRYLLDQMAEEGRGEVQYFLPGSHVADEVSRFYGRIRNPFLTDLAIEWDGVEVDEIYPSRIPDLFDGRPLMVHARYSGSGRGTARVSGRIAGKPWNATVPFRMPSRGDGNPAIGSLWARSKIADLEKDLRRGTSSETVEEITQIGLTHRLVTKYTSFVAVEEQFVVSNGRPQLVRVPLEMPEGVSYEGVFEGRMQSTFMTMSPPQTEESRWGALKSLGGRARSFVMPRTERRVNAGAPIRESLDATRSGDLRSVEPRETRESLGSLGGSNERKDDDAVANGPVDRLHSLRDAKAAADVRIVCTVPGGSTKVGESLELKITVTNHGSSEVSVPSSLDLTTLRLRVINAAWSERILGHARATVATVTLKPGARRTYRVRITPQDLDWLGTPGVYHFILEGRSFGAPDARRITVRVSVI